MSLFGSPPGSPSVPPLFRDDGDDDGLTPGGDILRASSQPVNVGGPSTTGGGLFDDVGEGDIWALPAPRSRSAGPGTSVPGGYLLSGGSGGGSARTKDVIKGLLNHGNSNLPSVYGELYEKVVGEYPALGFGGGMSINGVRRVIEEGGLDEDVGMGKRIKEAIVGVGMGLGLGDGIRRGEFSVLLAMVGLAQEGEEVSIDAVDDRRRHLPIPKLKTLLPIRPYESINQNGGHGGFDERDTSERATPGTSAASSALDHSQEINVSATTLANNSTHSPNQTITDSNPATTAPTTLDRSYTSPAAPGPAPGPAPAAASKPTTTLPRNRVVSNSSYTRPAMPDPAEQDPWGSPDMHVTHAHQQPAIGKNIPISAPPDEHEPDDLQAALRAHTVVPRASSASAWGGYDGSNVSHQVHRVGTGVLSGYGGVQDAGGFGGVGGGGLISPTMGVNRMGSFGGLGGNLGGNQQQQQGQRGGLRPAGVRAEESVTITVLPEKEGMFLFQHRNYQISSGRRASRVVRRYSDFVWLLDCLHKRYPFRCLPLLPPKRLAADATFLENRRRGLIRFTNFLIRHPVLSQEQLVIMFLTIPTELSVWRKQANLNVVDEYTTRLQTLSQAQIKGIEASLPPNLEQTFETVRSGLRRSAEIYIGLCSLVERLGKRQEGLAGELGRFAQALDGLTDVSEATYAIDTGDVEGLNEGLRCVGRYLGNAMGLLVDEAKGWEEGVLEDMKRQRDGIVAMREMFERRERMSGDAVNSLEKRIAGAKKKIEVIRARPDPPPPMQANGSDTPAIPTQSTSSRLSSALTGSSSTAYTKDADIKKLEEQIVKDWEAIVECRARRVLQQEGLRDELVYFHSSQFHVARMHQDWGTERVKYAELMAENWRGLQSGLEGMVVGE